MGLIGNYNSTRLKRQMDRAHDALLRRGFLEKVEYTKNTKGEWQVSYTFGSRVLLPPQTQAPVQTPSSAFYTEDVNEGQPMLPMPDAKALARKAAKERAALLAQATDADRARAREEALAWLRESMPEQAPSERTIASTAESKLAALVKARLDQAGKGRVP